MKWELIEKAWTDGRTLIFARFAEDEEPEYELGKWVTRESWQYVDLGGNLFRREKYDASGFDNDNPLRMTHFCQLTGELQGPEK